jgi:Pentapeptide repeats (8 copies)
MPIVEIKHKETGRVLETVEAGTLRGCDLQGARLDFASLAGLDMRGCDLTQASLVQVDLRKVNLCGSILLGAKLQGADLRFALFSRAHLGGVQLEGAQIAWNSPELISEILRQHAFSADQKAFARYGLIHGLCWDELVALNHAEAGWACSILKTHLIDGDDAPDFLRWLPACEMDGRPRLTLPRPTTTKE